VMSLQIHRRPDAQENDSLGSFAAQISTATQMQQDSNY